MMEAVDGPIQHFLNRKVPSLLQVVTAGTSIPLSGVFPARGSGAVHRVDTPERRDEMRVERWNDILVSAQTAEQVETTTEVEVKKYNPVRQSIRASCSIGPRHRLARHQRVGFAAPRI